MITGILTVLTLISCVFFLVLAMPEIIEDMNLGFRLLYLVTILLAIVLAIKILLGILP